MAWALGILGLGAITLALGAAAPGEASPAWWPAGPVVTRALGLALALTAAAVLWRRTAAVAAAALAAVYVVVMIGLKSGPAILKHPLVFGSYNGPAAFLALAAAGLILYAERGRVAPRPARRLVQGSRIAFGLCALVFGAAHFVFTDLTTPLVPPWLPPSRLFWAYATGVAHIAAGLALVSGVQARLAATLLAVMYASFTPLVHLPWLLREPHNTFVWAENALNVALTGAAWVVAASLAGSDGTLTGGGRGRPRRGGPRRRWR